ncbi:hypothetical protein SLE2022_220610 [Rubroshorea leprosula]
MLLNKADFRPSTKAQGPRPKSQNAEFVSSAADPRRQTPSSPVKYWLKAPKLPISDLNKLYRIRFYFSHSRSGWRHLAQLVASVIRAL